jgi:Glycosyltransferase Family 4
MRGCIIRRRAPRGKLPVSPDWGNPRLRIAYVCYWNLLEKDGVAKKINGQIAYWRGDGHEVEVFCVSRAVEPRSSWRLFPFETMGERFRATRALEAATLAWQPDAVYLRLDLFLPPLAKLLRRVPTVVELQSNDREEAKLRRVNHYSSRLYNELARPIHLSRARGLVCVTHEIAALPHIARHDKPTIVIGNGVDLVKLRELPAADGQPRAVFLASVGQAWHGVDKLIWLADRLPEVQFDFVGYRPQDLPSPPPPNLAAHGVLSREQYEPILASSDVGLGTLALHRLSMREACTLKVREYLGYGLPIVIGYEDTDLMGYDPWYVLRLPNEEGNVRERVDEIRAFIRRVHGRRVPRAEIEDRIGAHVKERRRLDFIRGAVGR